MKAKESTAAERSERSGAQRLRSNSGVGISIRRRQIIHPRSGDEVDRIGPRRLQNLSSSHAADVTRAQRIAGLGIRMVIRITNPAILLDIRLSLC